jgi:hypothetical protein
MIFLISASSVARSTGVCHQHPARLNFLDIKEILKPEDRRTLEELNPYSFVGFYLKILYRILDIRTSYFSWDSDNNNMKEIFCE